MTEEAKSSRVEVATRYFFPVILFLIACCYFGIYALYGVNLLDEGYLLNPALRVLRGELPGKDFYHFYPPGRFYLLSVLMSVFGVGISVERWTFVILRSFEAVLSWKLLARYSTRRWGLIAYVGILLVPGPAHKVFFGLSVLLILNALAWCVERPGMRKYFIYGALIGFIALLRHDVAAFGVLIGIIAIAASAEKPVRERMKTIAFMAFGILVLLMFPVAVWHIQGSLGDILHQAIVAGPKGNRANAIPFPAPWEGWSVSLHDGLKSACFWVGPVIYSISFIYLYRDYRRRDSTTHSPNRVMMLAIAVMGVLCLNQARIRSDLPHLYQALTPVFVAVGLLCYPFFKAGGKLRWIASALLPVALLAMQTLGSSDLYHGTPSVMIGRDVRLKTGRGELALTGPEADQLGRILKFIDNHTARGDAILVVPQAPLIYFLSDRKNPTRFELLRQGRWTTVEKEKAVVDDIRAALPKVVIYEDQSHLPPEKRFARYAPRIETYLKNNYCEADRAVSFKLMLPVGSAECRHATGL